jgi:hypothetical protein
VCDVRPAQIRVRNAEVLVAGGDESAAGDVAADGAADVTVKDDAAQTLHNSQISWVYSLSSRRPSRNLIVDINGLTFLVEMLRRVLAEADPGTAAVGGASAAAALEPQRPSHAERRHRCWLSLKNARCSEWRARRALLRVKPQPIVLTSPRPLLRTWLGLRARLPPPTVPMATATVSPSTAMATGTHALLRVKPQPISS